MLNSTCVILASDFSNSVVDPLRDEWTVGKMAILIEVLGETPVVITTDKGSGHTEIGVKLIKAYNGGASVGPRVTVERTLSDDTTQRTNFWLPGVGETIVPLEAGKAKWDALQLYRARSGEAIARVRPDAEAEGYNYGRWEAYPTDSATRFNVRYTPQ